MRQVQTRKNLNSSFSNIVTLNPSEARMETSLSYFSNVVEKTDLRQRVFHH